MLRVLAIALALLAAGFAIVLVEKPGSQDSPPVAAQGQTTTLYYGTVQVTGQPAALVSTAVTLETVTGMRCAIAADSTLSPNVVRKDSQGNTIYSIRAATVFTVDNDPCTFSYGDVVVLKVNGITAFTGAHVWDQPTVERNLSVTGPSAIDNRLLYEGWNPLGTWPAYTLWGVANIVEFLDSAVVPNTWQAAAEFANGWKQTFPDAPLPAFNTLVSVEPGKLYWLFVQEPGSLKFEQLPVPTPTPTATVTVVTTPTSTRTPSPTPSITLTPTVTNTPLEGTPTPSPTIGACQTNDQISIVGIDTGKLGEEIVTLRNDGAATSMNGWRLVSVVGGEEFRFSEKAPNFIFMGDGAQVRIHSFAVQFQNTPTDLWWTGALVWSSGEDPAELYDCAEALVDEYP